MTAPYEAIIEGTRREITGMDAEGNYLLDDGEKFVLQPFEPESFRASTLRMVSKLTFTGEKWLLDGENVRVRWIDSLEKAGGLKGMNSEALTEMHTLRELNDKLDALPAKERTKINGVAWFNERFDDVEAQAAEGSKKWTARVGKREFQCESRSVELPPAKQFEAVLLTDFGIITESAGPQRAEAGRYAASYEAVIEGKKRIVSSDCFDTQGNLVLAGRPALHFRAAKF